MCIVIYAGVNPWTAPGDGRPAASADGEVLSCMSEPYAGSMAVTVLEEQLQRRIRRERRDAEAVGVRQGMQQGIEQGVQRALTDTRDLLGGLVARKFGPGTATRTAALLAGIGDAEGLRRAGEWIIDCATADELVARLENGSP